MNNKKMIYLVAGARPNFMKIAPLVRALSAYDDVTEFRIIHTGQHYDKEMSDIFFHELGIPKPDYHLECGGGTHAEQTAKIMLSFEKICQQYRPQCVLVVGDVNSTLACSITAKKLNIPVAHVEAGLRSGDLSMPEEINRLVTDSIADWFFCTEPSARENLLREGKEQQKVFEVGHVMVDNLLYQASLLTEKTKEDLKSTRLKQGLQQYGIVTLHRPSNVDNPKVLEGIVESLNLISTKLPLIFPIHPRTQLAIERASLTLNANITKSGPMGYMEFLNLWRNATLVLTDSGGLQEETTALGVPCLTIRENTERPITVEQGTNLLVGTQPHNIVREALRVIKGESKKGNRPDLWDGKAAERIIGRLVELL
jgi:UDP-N-acetylglucosamine 2-epimerase (non-hydrolysing)